MASRQTKVTLSAQVAGYVKGMEDAAKKTRDLGSEAEKLAQKKDAFERMGRGALLAGTAITAATALSVKAAIDWESAWAGVTKTVDGNAEEMGVLEDQLRSLATTLPATHQEIAAVAEAAGQLGVQRENVAEFTRTMIDLATTTNLSADEAATSIAQFMNIMQSAPQDVDNLGAALVALGNDGASTERDIIQMAQNIAGAGKIVGLTEAQVLGLANALASVGIDAEAGGSSVSKVMTDIAMAVSAGGDELEQFASVAGMSSAQFQKAFKEDPADAIATFIEGLARINAQGGDVFKTLSDLGQTDIRVSRALLGMANSGDLLRKSLELGSVAWEDNLALIEEARKRYQTTEARIQIMNNSIRDAAISAGDVFLPAVKSAADGVAGLARGFSDLPDPVQGLVGIFGGVAGAVALTGGAAILAVPKIAEFRIAMQTLGTTASRVALIGGGVTVALTALVAVVGSVAAAQAEAQQRAESYAQALEQGGDAAKDLAIQNLAIEKTLPILGSSFGSAYDNAEKLGIGLDIVTEAASGSAPAMEKLNKTLDVALVGGTATQKMADELGISYLDLQQSAAVLKEIVEGESAARVRGNEILQQTKKATDETTESTNDAADAYLGATDNVDDLNDKLTKLIDTINEANGVGQDAVSANLDYKDALAGVDEVIQKAREGAEGFSLTLDENTQQGRDNKQMLVDLAAQAQEAADKQFALDGNTENYRKTLETSRQALIDRATALGANAEEAEALADQIFRIPDDTEWELIAQTASAAQTLDTFVRTYDGKVITMTLNTNQVVVGDRVYGGLRDGRASGGPVFGPGTPTSDSIPMMLSNNEHVWSAAEVQAAGGHGAVEQIRNWVRTGRGIPSAASSGGSPVVNVYAAPGMDVDALADKVVRKVERKLR